MLYAFSDRATVPHRRSYLQKNRDKYVAEARKLVGELQKTVRVNVESLAVIPSQNSKGRFLPSSYFTLSCMDSVPQS